jgi:hypothetical protein
MVHRAKEHVSETKGRKTEAVIPASRTIIHEPGEISRGIMRSYLLVNLTSLNYLPMMERWFFKDKVMETISQLGPMLYRYVTYRAVTPPDGADNFGYYNWRMIEHWWHDSPFRKGLDYGAVLADYWPPHYNEAVGIGSEKSKDVQEWRPPGPVHIFVPPRPTEDFKGMGLSLADGNNIRWIMVFRYPEGVSKQEGDDWYINVHAKEVCQQPGLKRFFSFHAIEPSSVVGPWARVSELWYENHDAWKKAVIESPPKFSKPPWATFMKYPYLNPGVDFVSTFLLEHPECDFLREYRGYTVTA